MRKRFELRRRMGAEDGGGRWMKRVDGEEEDGQKGVEEEDGRGGWARRMEEEGEGGGWTRRMGEEGDEDG